MRSLRPTGPPSPTVAWDLGCPQALPPPCSFQVRLAPQWLRRTRLRRRGCVAGQHRKAQASVPVLVSPCELGLCSARSHSRQLQDRGHVQRAEAVSPGSGIRWRMMDETRLREVVLYRSPGHPGPSVAHSIPLQVTGKVPFCSEVPRPLWMPPFSRSAPFSPANPATHPLNAFPAPHPPPCVIAPPHTPGRAELAGVCSQAPGQACWP